MDKQQQDFLNELLNDFKIEAQEHYHALVNGLILLEKTTDPAVQKSTIENIFREVHSLKGAARAVNLLDIEKLCMNMETVFNSLKKGESLLLPDLFDVFYKASDLLSLLLEDVNKNKKHLEKYNLVQILKNLEFIHRNSIKSAKVEPQQPSVDEPIIEPIAETVSEPIVGQVIVKEETVEEPQSLDDTIVQEESLAVEPINTTVFEADDDAKVHHKEKQTVRISTDKLNNILQLSEEQISIKATLEYFINELQNINYQYIIWNKKATEKIKASDDSISEELMRDYLLEAKIFRKKHEEDLSQLHNEMQQFQRIASRMIEEQMHEVRTALLFPFSSILSVFPKIVRDLSRDYSKDIDFHVIGDSIEIDRRILEEIKDPLIHLIRNCIDHGIESKSERQQKAKPVSGTIEICIKQGIDKQIEIIIKDDGAGINKTKLINSAIKQGILKSNEVEKLSDSEIYALIFSSGISTSPFITDISGRGLGMAIVAEKVAKLGGNIKLETAIDKGTSFIITLPQTLVKHRGVLVKASDQFFIIPSSSVLKVTKIHISQVKTVESRRTICYDNETIALTLLSDVLKISADYKRRNNDEYLYVLILNSAQKKIAFVVDQIIGEQEGIVKDLGSHLSNINNISGATILGNGKLVLILNPSQLIDSASNTGYAVDLIVENSAQSASTEIKKILVAEDSITIRTLLRNFIESAGFSVVTAVDGMAAYHQLQTEDFDLVVSDIEMPRMNGFELTSKIRENSKYSNLPIILVTALETADDKQRGMEVGANAYIVKSSFEKSNLIETIQRLI